jgi:hypothetical protein
MMFYLSRQGLPAASPHLSVRWPKPSLSMWAVQECQYRRGGQLYSYGIGSFSYHCLLATWFP